MWAFSFDDPSEPPSDYSDVDESVYHDYYTGFTDKDRHRM